MRVFLPFEKSDEQDHFFLDYFQVEKMEKFGISVIIFTVFWGLIGIVLPFLIPKGPNRR